MGTVGRGKFSVTCEIYLFVTYKQFRICQEFCVVLLASFSPLVWLRPFCVLPLGVKTLFLCCVLTRGSCFLSVPLGSMEGVRRSRPPTLVVHRVVGWAAGPGLADPWLLAQGRWNPCLPLDCSFSRLQTCLIFPKVTLEFFDKGPESFVRS